MNKTCIVCKIEKPSIAFPNYRRTCRSCCGGTQRKRSLADNEWMQDALCRGQDTELFFSIAADDVREAEAFCQACPVMKACEAYRRATHQEYGTWGGVNLEFRRQQAQNRVKREWRARCGTRASYDQGCRCEECRDAWRHYYQRNGDRIRERRRERRARLAI